MLIKLLIALAIGSIMLSYNGSGTTNIKNSVSDTFLTSNSVMLDKAIVSYYCNHHGSLPDKLDADTLIVMGMQDMDLSKFKYTKVSDRQFKLEITLSNSKTITSAHSNTELFVPLEVN